MTAQQHTFDMVARNMDMRVIGRIKQSRQLPDEWKSVVLYALAHRLYWEEHDEELLAAGRVTQHYCARGIETALREEPSAQHVTHRPH